MNSSWNKTICNVLLERYLSKTDGQPEYAENLLKLVHLVGTWLGCANFQLSSDSRSWLCIYMKSEIYQFQARFTQHCNQHEWPVARLLLGVLRIVLPPLIQLIEAMNEDVHREKLRMMEEMVMDDMQEFQGETEKCFNLIR